MAEECNDIKAEADRAGDEHYRAMTDWTTRGHSNALRERAHRAAISYRKALSWLVDCLQRVRSSFFGGRRLERTIELKQSVERDIEILEANTQGTEPG